MKPDERDRSNQSKAVLIEWQVYEDDHDWHLRNARESEGFTPQVQPHPGLPQWAWRWVAPCLLLLIVLLPWGGHWLQDRAAERA